MLKTETNHARMGKAKNSTYIVEKDVQKIESETLNKAKKFQLKNNVSNGYRQCLRKRMIKKSSNAFFFRKTNER